MSKAEKKINPLCKAYPNVKILHGCAMDEASYERHVNAASIPPMPPVPSEPQAVPVQTAPAQDPFARPQDLRAIAAASIEEHSAASCQPQSTDAPAPTYRPGAANVETFVTEEGSTVRHLVFAPTAMHVTGSGSYLSSGSYSTSYVSSGSYRTSYTGSGSYVSSGSSYGFAQPAGEESSDVPFGYGSDMHLLGGYGLDLI